MTEATTETNAQKRFYKDVRKGYETRGIQIEKPTRIYDIVDYNSVIPRASPSPKHYPSSESSPFAPPLPAAPAPRRPKNYENEHLQRRSEEKRTKPSGAGNVPVLNTPASIGVGNCLISSSIYCGYNCMLVQVYKCFIYSVLAVFYSLEIYFFCQHEHYYDEYMYFVVAEHQLSDLHSNTRALKCLLDAVQDNSSKVTSDIKSELKRLGRIVENLSRNFERLENEVENLKQGQTSTSDTTPHSTYGNIPSIERNGKITS